MRGAWKFLVGAVLGAILGWSLGYLRLPLVSERSGYWIGGLSGIVLVVFFLAVWWFLRPKRSARRSSGKSGRIGRMVVPAALTVLLAATVYLGWKNYARGVDISRKTQTLENEQRIATERERARSAIALLGPMGDLLKEIVADRERDTLRTATIDRIAALSYGMKPYRNWEADTLAEVYRSPERGQFLLNLLALDLDSLSWSRIKGKTSFAFADLRRADLQGADLRLVDLQRADLKQANLRFARLDSADLLNACLWGIQLDSAKLPGAMLRRTDLRWAEINGADLAGANLNGANLRDAKLRGTRLTDAFAQWSFADRALLNGADLRRTDFLGADMVQTSLRGCDLREANLMAVVLTDALLGGAELTDATCGPDVVTDSLEKWRIVIAPELEATYKVIDDTARRYVSAGFRLVRK
ncbi:MAG: pentapeptide repeat-containing protein [Bacteroidota bacterium]